MFARTAIRTTRLSLKNNRSFLTVIQKGQEGWRLTFGRNPEHLLPGLRLNIPIIHTVIKQDMREGGIEIDEIGAYTDDNVPVFVGGTLFYQIVDSNKACFGAQNIIPQVGSVGTSALRSVIGGLKYDDINSDRQGINTSLVNQIGDKIEQDWGVRCTKFEIQSFTPQTPEMKDYLEKQMKAERDRRETLLNTEANVNIADGEKRSCILRSEGEKTQAYNRADGTQREMDAVTDAMKKRVEDLMAATGDSGLSTEIIIQDMRVEAFKALSKGPNNTTYVVPSDGLGSKLPDYKLFGDALKN